jgi:hypothetical protein
MWLFRIRHNELASSRFCLPVSVNTGGGTEIVNLSIFP